MNIKLKALFLIFVLIFVFRVTPATESIADVSKTMKPVVVLVERNPWLMVIGSDSPVFALYDDGTLIYYEKPKGYFSLKLNKEQIKQFIPNKAFKNLKSYYSSSDWTDQPTNSIFYWENNKRYSVTVYGSLRKAQEDRKKTPKEFLRTYDKLIKKINYKSNKWLPKYIEVIIWPFDYSKDSPVKWPSNWPNINHKMTKKKGKNSYSIYLESKLLNELVMFLRKMKSTQAVLINGKKWAISYRYPFPKEEMWMK